MTLADEIRAHASRRYIQPARRTAPPVPSTVTIVSGDIVRDLKLVRRGPAVCGALDSQKFQDEYNIKLVHRIGPLQGHTSTWQFLV
jgi:hypothetical protein